MSNDASRIHGTWHLKLLWLLAGFVFAAPSWGLDDGPFGIDHRLRYDDSGIWKRSNQLGLIRFMVGGATLGSFLQDNRTPLGRTYDAAVRAAMIAGASAQVAKYSVRRARPQRTDDPSMFFQGGSNFSFFSAEVATVSAIVTPFVLEYRHAHPAIYALELLPVYDAIARMKVWGHWQSDVLVGYAVGTLAGYWAHTGESPLVVSPLPDGVVVGYRVEW